MNDNKGHIQLQGFYVTMEVIAEPMEDDIVNRRLGSRSDGFFCKWGWFFFPFSSELFFFLLCWDCDLGLRHRRVFVRISHWREKNPNPNFVRVLLEPADRTSWICFQLVFLFLLGQHGESLDGVHLQVDLGRPCCTLWTLSKPAFRVVAKLGFPYRLEI